MGGDRSAGRPRAFVLAGQLQGLAGGHAFLFFFWKAQGAQLSSVEDNQELVAGHRLLTHGDKGRNFLIILVIVVETHWTYTLSLKKDFGPIEAVVLLCL